MPSSLECTNPTSLYSHAHATSFGTPTTGIPANAMPTRHASQSILPPIVTENLTQNAELRYDARTSCRAITTR